MSVNILNLIGYAVSDIRETVHDYHIDAEASNPPDACIHCQNTHVVSYGRVDRTIRDLPVHAKRVAIYLASQRYRCRACKKTFVETPPAIDTKREMTERLVKWIGQQSLKRTFASIAEDVGVDEKTVRNIFRDYVNELEARFRFETPKWMGIDEIHLIEYRCVISNIENNTLIEMLPSRDKKSVIKYLNSLPDRSSVKYVVMDMWQPYRDAVQEVMPNATIIVDKFHVVQYANKAIELARTDLRSQLEPKERRKLMHDRFVLLKRQRDLEPYEITKIESWFAQHPVLEAAYRAKEGLYGIYETCRTPAEAKVAYRAWRETIPEEVSDSFAELTRAWDNWEPWIVNYFEHPITNAYKESLNNLIRVMDRLGRGYSFEALRAKLLFTEGVHKKDRVRPKFQKMPTMCRVIERPKEPVMGLGIEMRRQFLPVANGVGPSVEVNYGADLATLAQLIEDGLL